jgi:ribosomal protein L28
VVPNRKDRHARLLSEGVGGSRPIVGNGRSHGMSRRDQLNNLQGTMNCETTWVRAQGQVLDLARLACSRAWVALARYDLGEEQGGLW